MIQLHVATVYQQERKTSFLCSNKNVHPEQKTASICVCVRFLTPN